jgi:hypothetical protein
MFVFHLVHGADAIVVNVSGDAFHGSPQMLLF